MRNTLKSIPDIYPSCPVKPINCLTGVKFEDDLTGDQYPIHLIDQHSIRVLHPRAIGYIDIPNLVNYTANH